MTFRIQECQTDSLSTKSNLAITYSDDSVLERMHIAELYRILSDDVFDVLSHMTAPERVESRKIIIDMIHATGLTRHFQRISVLETKKFAVSEEAQGLELSLLMETMLMLADLGHTAKPFAYHQTWAERISEEFFRQGENETHNSLPRLASENQLSPERFPVISTAEPNLQDSLLLSPEAVDCDAPRVQRVP